MGGLPGSLSPRTKFSKLSEFELSPSTDANQKALLSICEKIENCRNKLNDLNRSLSMLKSVIVGDSLHFRESDNSFDLVPVKDLLASGPRNGYSPKTTSNGKGYRTFPISAIRDGKVKLDPSNFKYAEITKSEFSANKISSGDIFVVRGNGNVNLVGSAGMVETDLPDVFYPDILIKIPIRREIVDPEYFVAVWNSPFVRKQILAMAQTTNGTYKINKSIVESIKFPLPPKIFQRKITYALSESAQFLEESGSKLQHLKNINQKLVEKLIG